MDFKRSTSISDDAPDAPVRAKAESPLGAFRTQTSASERSAYGAFAASSGISRRTFLIGGIAAFGSVVLAGTMNTIEEAYAATVRAMPQAERIKRIERRYGRSLIKHPEKNIFLDALTYAGYDMPKRIASGKQWEYDTVKWSEKSSWLSDIGYGNPGCSGYETDAAGKPDLALFREKGLVCASYVTYVYFNYLPNVMGIDVSRLQRPSRPRMPIGWYDACTKWVEDGYSHAVKFDVEITRGCVGHGRIRVVSDEEIPVGSVVLFRNSYRRETGSLYHAALWAGEMNGEQWLTQVCSDDGPDFMPISVMNYGSEPTWPVYIFTTPNFIG